jgi:hypothetical protein
METIFLDLHQKIQDCVVHRQKNATHPKANPKMMYAARMCPLVAMIRLINSPQDLTFRR